MVTPHGGNTDLTYKLGISGSYSPYSGYRQVDSGHSIVNEKKCVRVSLLHPLPCLPAPWCHLFHSSLTPMLHVSHGLLKLRRFSSLENASGLQNTCLAEMSLEETNHS